ncbi:MraY family glycosyltransferase [Porphyromonadaceae bacterium]
MIYLFILLAFLVSALWGWITIPSIVIISKKKRLFDVVSERKSHSGEVPRLGGISFYPAFLTAFCALVALRFSINLDVNHNLLQDLNIEILYFISGATMLYFIGLADDLSELGYRTKFLVQTLSSILLAMSGVYIKNLHGLFGIYELYPAFGMILTVLISVFIINAYNLIDGIDGLCSGLAFISLSFLCFWFSYNHIYSYAMMAASMLGVLSVFFIYNTTGKRMKVFMGDTGSLMLGFLIIYLSLKFYDLNSIPAFSNSINAPAVFVGLLFIPAFDTFRVFIVRIMAGESPFVADKRHIHHKLLRLQLPHIYCTLIILLAQVLFLALNFFLSHLSITIVLFIDILFGIILIKVFDILGNRKERAIDNQIKHITL